MASEDSSRHLDSMSCIDGSSCDAWPFLLIVRTGSVVTACAVAPDTRVFQHIASCTHQDHSCEGQSTGHEPVENLRTVIVPELPISLWGVDHIFFRRLQRRSPAYGL